MRVLLQRDWPVTTTVTIEQEEQVKSREQIVKMLEAFDLCGRCAMPASWLTYHITPSLVTSLCTTPVGHLTRTPSGRWTRSSRSATRVRSTQSRAVAEVKANYRKGRRRVYWP
jgi:hypothetical protein